MGMLCVLLGTVLRSRSPPGGTGTSPFHQCPSGWHPTLETPVGLPSPLLAQFLLCLLTGGRVPLGPPLHPQLWPGGRSSLSPLPADGWPPPVHSVPRPPHPRCLPPHPMAPRVGHRNPACVPGLPVRLLCRGPHRAAQSDLCFRPLRWRVVAAGAGPRFLPQRGSARSERAALVLVVRPLAFRVCPAHRRQARGGSGKLGFGEVTGKLHTAFHPQVGGMS